MLPRSFSVLRQRNVHSQIRCVPHITHSKSIAVISHGRIASLSQYPCEQRILKTVAVTNAVFYRNNSSLCGQHHSGLLTNHNLSLGSHVSSCHGYHQRRHASTTATSEGFAYYLSPEFPPISAAMQVLEGVHSVTGLPWWGSIIVTTFALRSAVTLPLAIYAAKHMAKVESLGPELAEKQKILKMEVAHAVRTQGWSNQMANKQYAINMKRITQQMYEEHNAHPLKGTVLALVQIPMWLSMSCALRNMSGVFPWRGANLPVLTPDLAVEGTLWFPNLLLGDTTFILPLIMASCNIAINEMYSLRVEKLYGFNKATTIFMRGFSIILIPVAATVPSCMALYWASSSLYGLVQNTCIRLPKVRRFLGIPKMASESETPFQDMVKNAKLRYGRKKKKEEKDEDKT